MKFMTDLNLRLWVDHSSGVLNLGIAQGWKVWVSEAIPASKEMAAESSTLTIERTFRESEFRCGALTFVCAC